MGPRLILVVLAVVALLLVTAGLAISATGGSSGLALILEGLGVLLLLAASAGWLATRSRSR